MTMKDTIKKAAAVSILVLGALPALAGGVDWNSDPVAQAREALAQARKEHPVSTPAAVAVPSSIEAAPAGASVHPYADDLGADVTDRVDAYLAKGHDKILADFSTCDERFDDCSALRFSFPQLTVDFAGRTVKLGAETVATLVYDAKLAQGIREGRFYFGEDGIDHTYEVKWSAGWTLAQRTRQRHVSVALLKTASESYGGFVDFDGEPSLVCFTVAPASQGASARRVHLNEGNISCETTWDLGRDELALCSGELLTGLKGGLAKGKAMGDVLDAGAKKTPVASYLLVKEPGGCR